MTIICGMFLTNYIDCLDKIIPLNFTSDFSICIHITYNSYKALYYRHEKYSSSQRRRIKLNLRVLSHLSYSA